MKAAAPPEPSKVPMDELLLILNPSKTGRTNISVQSYSVELTWEQLPVISEQVVDLSMFLWRCGREREGGRETEGFRDRDRGRDRDRERESTHPTRFVCLQVRLLVAEISFEALAKVLKTVPVDDQVGRFVCWALVVLSAGLCQGFGVGVSIGYGDYQVLAHFLLINQPDMPPPPVTVCPHLQQHGRYQGLAAQEDVIRALVESSLMPAGSTAEGKSDPGAVGGGVPRESAVLIAR